MQNASAERIWHHSAMDYPQETARALVSQMLEATGLEPTQLARRAGVTPSTLTRFLNKPVKHTLSVRTLMKLSAASGVPIPMGGVAPLPSKGRQEIVHDAKELSWLDLWREMGEERQAAALAFLVSIFPKKPEPDHVTHQDQLPNETDKTTIKG